MADMRDFWDERAREDAAYFVENRIMYGGPLESAFWDEGPRIVDAVLATVDGAIGAGDHVVEVGCGVGRLTRVLVERAARVTAFDVSGEMVARARALTPDLDARWVVGDGLSLKEVGDGEADGVFSHVVFQHVPEPAITYGYVREMGRVLRPGGWAVFQVSTDPAIHRPAPLGVRVRGALRRGPRGQGAPQWVGSAVDLDDLRRTAERAHLEVAAVANPGTQFTYVRLRRR